MPIHFLKTSKDLHSGRLIAALVISLIGILLYQPAVLAKSSAPSPPKTSKSAVVIFDNFKGTESDLVNHSPVRDQVGNGWHVANGIWDVANGTTSDTLGYSEPYITTINPSASNYDVSIDVTWFGASEAGLVFRYENNSNYYSVVYTGKKLELRKTVDGAVTLLKKKYLNWKRFETKALKVHVDGPTILITLDKVKLKVNDADLEYSRKIGAIVQRTEIDSFKNFEVMALGPAVAPPSITIPAIVDATLFDSFDDALSTLPLSSHAPYKPAASAWTSHAGVWTVEAGELVASTGGNSGDLRATIETSTPDADIYTNITWESGLAGVVYRYVNESNWWMTFYDGHSLATISLSPEGFKVWDVTAFDWGAPGTTHAVRIRLNGYGVRIYADYEDLPKTVIVSDVLDGETRAGLFNRFGTRNSFSEFVVANSPALSTPDIIPTPPVPPSAATPPTTPPNLSLFDSFSDIPSQWNSLHEPDLAPLFRKWVVDKGRWITDFEFLTEVTGERTDQRAVIDSGVEDSLISAEVEWQSGRVGVVFRYRDERNWAMAWYDGVGDLVIGKATEGKYTEVGRSPKKIKPGNKIKFTVWTTNDHSNVRIDNKFIGTADVSELRASTFVGIFSRKLEAARFDNLQLEAPAVQPNPGGLIYTPIVIDSFTEPSFLQVDLPTHDPELKASTGWVEHSGKWVVENGTSRETFGFGADFRAAIPAVTGDQHVSTDISYHGGRVGINFRYYNESNWYMFWYDGVNIILGKFVGGNFNVLQQQGFNWGPAGTQRNLSVLVFGGEITAFVDGVDLLHVTGQNDLISADKAGLFSRSAPNSVFDNFVVNSVSP